MGRSTSVNLQHEVFGKLTVLGWSMAHSKWMCECQCGELAFATTTQLVDGKKTNCGCEPKERKKQYRKDITGQRFNKLVALHPDGYRWRVRCDCGNETSVGITALENGEAKSCGCDRIKNMLETRERNKNTMQATKYIGKEFGDAVIVRIVDKKKYLVEIQYDCFCDEIQRETVKYADLVRGKHRVCPICKALE